MKYTFLGLLLVLSTQAFGATGFLINCETGRGQNGRPAYIGKYDVDGKQVIRYFSRSQVRYCPTQLEIN